MIHISSCERFGVQKHVASSFLHALALDYESSKHDGLSFIRLCERYVHLRCTYGAWPLFAFINPCILSSIVIHLLRSWAEILRCVSSIPASKWTLYCKIIISFFNNSICQPSKWYRNVNVIVKRLNAEWKWRKIKSLCFVLFSNAPLCQSAVRGSRRTFNQKPLPQVHARINSKVLQLIARKVFLVILL